MQPIPQGISKEEKMSNQSKDLPSAAPDSVTRNTKVDIINNNQTVRTTLKGMSNGEHEKVYSRTLCRDVEIGIGPLPVGPSGIGGLVGKNPFASLAQAAYLHVHPEKLGTAKLAEFDKASKGRKIPYKVKKK
jgi:hypothetical protein